MDKDLGQRLIMGFLVLVMAGFLLFVLVAKPPWAIRPPVTDDTAMDDPTPTLSSTAPEIMNATDTPAVAEQSATASPLPSTPALAGATATPIPLNEETTATPVSR